MLHGLFSSCGEQGLLSRYRAWPSCLSSSRGGARAPGCVDSVCFGSRAPEHSLSSCGVRGLSCSEACGIFLYQESNLCLLHWLRDSLPLSHQGSPLTSICKMDHQQGPTAQHVELCAVLCGSLDGRGVWGRMDMCTCMAEALCCSPEIITALFVNRLCC